MKPIDANPHDWPLYYNGTWMQTVEGKPVLVKVEMGSLRGKSERGAYHTYGPEQLLPLWLRPGSYNFGSSTAGYVGRRARRSAKRSMDNNHYMMKWSKGMDTRVISGRALWLALRHTEYPSWEEALKALQSGEADARAVSRDLIIAQKGDGNKLGVILRGTYAGCIDKGLFVPHDENSPLAKMARGRLLMRGISC